MADQASAFMAVQSLNGSRMGSEALLQIVLGLPILLALLDALVVIPRPTHSADRPLHNSPHLIDTFSWFDFYLSLGEFVGLHLESIYCVVDFG